MAEYVEFSEFSYGYALVDNAARSGSWGGITGAPRFVSLLEEGSTGGGFDVALDFRALPLFLQFKIPQVMRRRSHRMPDGFSPPYYRMHLRTDRVNASGMTQHEQLLTLESQFPLCVYYVTPRFDTTSELDGHYLAGRVPDQSEWFSLSGFDAPPLSREPHRIAYQLTSSNTEVQSQPRPFHARYSFERMRTSVGERLSATKAMHPLRWLAMVEDMVFSATNGHDASAEPDIVIPVESAESGKRGASRDDASGRFVQRLRAMSATIRTKLDVQLALVVKAAATSS